MEPGEVGFGWISCGCLHGGGRPWSEHCALCCIAKETIPTHGSKLPSKRSPRTPSSTPVVVTVVPAARAIAAPAATVPVVIKGPTTAIVVIAPTIVGAPAPGLALRLGLLHHSIQRKYSMTQVAHCLPSSESLSFRIWPS